MLLDEYNAVRSRAGIWIREDAALVRVTGSDRYTWLQGMISNDTTLLSSESLTRLPACILDATGHLLSTITLTVSRDEPDVLLMEVPVNERTRILTLLDRYLITEDVELSPCDLTTVTVQGPGAGEVGAELSDNFECAYYASDHTGSRGFDIYIAPKTVEALVAAAGKLGAQRISTEVANLLRIEAGIPQFGVDMDATVIALEAGLGPTHISYTKGCYVGQEIIARIDSRGHTNRALSGMVFADGCIPSTGDKVLPAPTEAEPDPRETGRITSVAADSPAMGDRAIAMGYIRHEHRSPGSALLVGEQQLVAEVVELPFYRG